MSSAFALQMTKSSIHVVEKRMHSTLSSAGTKSCRCRGLCVRLDEVICVHPSAARRSAEAGAKAFDYVDADRFSTTPLRGRMEGVRFSTTPLRGRMVSSTVTRTSFAPQRRRTKFWQSEQLRRPRCSRLRRRRWCPGR
jgi:hypothetical protein